MEGAAADVHQKKLRSHHLVDDQGYPQAGHPGFISQDEFKFLNALIDNWNTKPHLVVCRKHLEPLVTYDPVTKTFKVRYRDSDKHITDRIRQLMAYKEKQEKAKKLFSFIEWTLGKNNKLSFEDN